MAYPVLALGLLGFWLLLSGHYTGLLLTLGCISVALAIGLSTRLQRAAGGHLRLRLSLQLLRYLAWLLWQVVLANLAVAKRILDPRLPIRPTWQAIDVSLQGPLQKTLYANSITLTPDTLTTHVQEDGRFMVHALWPESIEQLRSGEMQARIAKTEL